MLVAVRQDLHEVAGDFIFPSPVTGRRPAKTILTPLPIFEGKRFPSSARVLECNAITGAGCWGGAQQESAWPLSHVYRYVYSCTTRLEQNEQANTQGPVLGTPNEEPW